MNIIVGPSLCFGFNFKSNIIIDTDYLDEPVADEPFNLEPVIIKSKTDNIIDSLNNVETEIDKINILNKAVNANTINLNEDQQNEYIQYLTIFINNLDDPKLRQLLTDLYK